MKIKDCNQCIFFDTYSPYGQGWDAMPLCGHPRVPKGGNYPGYAHGHALEWSDDWEFPVPGWCPIRDGGFSMHIEIGPSEEQETAERIAHLMGE